MAVAGSGLIPFVWKMACLCFDRRSPSCGAFLQLWEVSKVSLHPSSPDDAVTDKTVINQSLYLSRFVAVKGK